MQPADRSDFRIAVESALTTELTRRRAEIAGIDPRLDPVIGLLIDFVTNGGKRIRPEFLWWGWRAAGGQPDPQDCGPVVAVAAALELVQACALLHDDVIDRSETRRGAPSAHRALEKSHVDAGMTGDADHFGVSGALLLGDLALAWADDLFLEGAARLNAIDRAAPVWRAMRTEVLAGQVLDLLVTAHPTVDPAAQERDASIVNRYKTAGYTVERPLQLGAVLAGGRAETVAALREFGVQVGSAFQLRDDLLGVFGEERVTGKPSGGDISEGKRTLLLAMARSMLAGEPEKLAELDAGLGVATSPSAVDRLVRIIADSGAPEAVERRIDDLMSTSLAALGGVDAVGRPLIEPTAALFLIDLASRATQRTS